MLGFVDFTRSVVNKDYKTGGLLPRTEENAWLIFTEAVILVED